MSTVDVDPLSLQPGTKLGEYKVRKRLGTGGMGTVYEVERDGYRFAAKLSKQKLSDMSQAEREATESRIRREISILWGVDHPNLVRIEGTERWPNVQGYFVIITELVEGSPLLVWQDHEKPSFKRLAAVFAELCEGLAVLHEKSFCHRDLKSDNVMVDLEGRPVIIDFGIARGDSNFTVTQAGMWLGTSDHLSPEYCRFILSLATAPDSPKFKFLATHDLHAVGVMLYIALTGQLPFDDENDLHLLQLIANKPPRPILELAPTVPAPLVAICNRLLEKDPSTRFQSATEVADALGSALASADASWDAPYARPAYLGNRRGSASTAEAKPRARRARTSPPPVSTANLPAVKPANAAAADAANVQAGLSSLLLDSTSARPSPAVPAVEIEVGSAERDIPKPPPPVATSAARGQPAAAPPAFNSVAAERRDFVSVERAAPVDARASEPKAEPHILPTALRAHAEQLKGAAPSKTNKGTIALVGGGLALVALVVAVGAFSTPEQPKQSQSLLDSFEKERADQLAPKEQKKEAPPTLTVPPVVPKDENAEQLAQGNALKGETVETMQLPSTAETMEQKTAAKTAKKSGGGGVKKKQEAAPVVVAEQQQQQQPPPVRRVFVQSTAVKVADQQAGGAKGGPLGVTRGQLLAARLVTPVDPTTGGPVTAKLTQDVVVGGAVVIPKGSTLVGSSSSSGQGRVAVAWDSVNVPNKGSFAFDGSTLGADKKPGLAVTTSGGQGAGTDVGNAALRTAGRLTNRVLGDGVASDIGKGVVEAGDSAGQRKVDGAGAVNVHTVPAGTSLFVFVQQAF